MELDNLILEKIKTTRIYGVTKPLIVKEILCIPDEVNIKKLDLHIDECYDTFYIKKNWSNKKRLTREEKYEKFLNTEKEKTERIKELPSDANKTEYRKIVTINKDWLKKTQKKFNKILMSILLDKKIRGVKYV